MKKNILKATNEKHFLVYRNLIEWETRKNWFGIVERHIWTEYSSFLIALKKVIILWEGIMFSIRSIPDIGDLFLKNLLQEKWLLYGNL